MVILKYNYDNYSMTFNFLLSYSLYYLNWFIPVISSIKSICYLQFYSNTHHNASGTKNFMKWRYVFSKAQISKIINCIIFVFSSLWSRFRIYCGVKKKMSFACTESYSVSIDILHDNHVSKCCLHVSRHLVLVHHY